MGTKTMVLVNLKKKEILSPIAAWMNLEDTMLSKISQPHTDKYCTIPPI
jgi:hypothetical protein